MGAGLGSAFRWLQTNTNTQQRAPHVHFFQIGAQS
jgi:hypothetical protein